MRVALGDSNVTVTGELLGQLQIATRPAQYCRDEIMSERVGGNRLSSDGASGLGHTLIYDVAPGGGGDRLYLLTRAAIVAGE